MTNIVAFQPRPAPNGAPDLVRNLNDQLLNAIKAKRQVERARSMQTCLGYYANFLRVHHEIDGGTKSALHWLEQAVGRFTTDANEDRVARLVEHLDEIDDMVRGALPWLCLPSFDRFQFRAETMLGEIVKHLTEAVAVADAICRRIAVEPPRGAA